MDEDLDDREQDVGPPVVRPDRDVVGIDDDVDVLQLGDELVIRIDGEGELGREADRGDAQPTCAVAAGEPAGEVGAVEVEVAGDVVDRARERDAPVDRGEAEAASAEHEIGEIDVVPGLAGDRRGGIEDGARVEPVEHQLQDRGDVVERGRAIAVVDRLLAQEEGQAGIGNAARRAGRQVVGARPQKRLHASARVPGGVRRVEHQHVAADLRRDRMAEAAVGAHADRLAAEGERLDLAQAAAHVAHDGDGGLAPGAEHGGATRRELDVDGGSARVVEGRRVCTGAALADVGRARVAVVAVGIGDAWPIAALARRVVDAVVARGGRRAVPAGAGSVGAAAASGRVVPAAGHCEREEPGAEGSCAHHGAPKIPPRATHG